MVKPHWQKSSFSSNDGNYGCLELANTADSVLIRESDEPDVVIRATPVRVAALLAAVKLGRGPR